MDNSDREMMRDSLAGLLETGDRLQRARAATTAGPGADRTTWTELAANGWLDLMTPEDSGGIGAEASDAVVLLEALGRQLSPEPLGPALAATGLLSAFPAPVARALAAAQLAGTGITLLAQPSTFPMPGRPSHVLVDAQWADHVLLPHGSGAAFRLEVAALRDTPDNWPVRTAIDGTAMRFLDIEQVATSAVAEGPDAERATAAAQNRLRLFAAASLCGIGAQVLDDVVAFLKLRRQFGVPIGTFQALQHRAASMHVGSLAVRALVREAALAIGTAQERRACAMAKLKSSAVVSEIVKEGVQMHGAVGFSDELPLALHFRRAVALSHLFGTADECRNDLG